MKLTKTHLKYYRQNKIPSIGNLLIDERVINVHHCINSHADIKTTRDTQKHNTWEIIKSLNKRYSGVKLCGKLLTIKHNTINNTVLIIFS